MFFLSYLVVFYCLTAQTGLLAAPSVLHLLSATNLSLVLLLLPLLADFCRFLSILSNIFFLFRHRVRPAQATPVIIIFVVRFVVGFRDHYCCPMASLLVAWCRCRNKQVVAAVLHLLNVEFDMVDIPGQDVGSKVHTVVSYGCAFSDVLVQGAFVLCGVKRWET